MNYVFAGNWNHLERLGMTWYSDKIKGDVTFPFDYFDDSNPKRNLEFVREAINSVRPPTGSKGLLSAALTHLIERYKPNKYYHDVSFSE
jgi:hypothetical protein